MMILLSIDAYIALRIDEETRVINQNEVQGGNRRARIRTSRNIDSFNVNLQLRHGRSCVSKPVFAEAIAPQPSPPIQIAVIAERVRVAT